MRRYVKCVRVTLYVSWGCRSIIRPPLSPPSPPLIPSIWVGVVVVDAVVCDVCPCDACVGGCRSRIRPPSPTLQPSYLWKAVRGKEAAGVIMA